MNYFICSTHRTGSNLLYNLLYKSNIAGNPLELFLCLEAEWRNKYPEYWSENQENITPNLFLEKIKLMGTGDNGVFGCKMMWGSFVETMNYLRNIPEYQDMKGIDILLDNFSEPKFIFTTRRSKVRQAVSFVKAQKSGVFYKLRSGSSLQDKETKKLEYNFKEIFTSYQMLIKDEMNWIRFLIENNINFKTIVYEDLIKNPEAAVYDIINFLEIDIPEKKHIEPDIIKQSNELNESWVKKFKNDMLSKGLTVC